MARLPRLALAGLPHLVALYGHPGATVFVDDEDRRQFLTALREAARQHQVAVHAYVLAADHVHLLVTPAEAAGLGAMVQSLGRRYVGTFNRRHGRSGTLWAGRYRGTVVQPGATLLEALLFIDLHAVRHNTVHTAEDALFCSARHHLGQVRDGLLTVSAAYWALGNTPFEREAVYRRLLDEGLAPDRVQAVAEAMRKGWALGDAAFLTAVGQQAGRPVRPRPRGRPARDLQ